MVEYAEIIKAPLNDIYWIPVMKVSFLECLDEPPAVGHEETRYLSEGKDAESARSNLSKYPGCGNNWNRLTAEQKTRIPPFLIDYCREVEKVLYCERRFKDYRGNYTCGMPVNENGELDFNGLNGEFGGCCIDGYSIPNFEDCPYNQKLVELNLR